MRRNALLAAAAVAAAVTLASCSGGGPSAQANGKAHTDPATVVDGMHYVQLFNTVDPVLTRLQSAAKSAEVPTSAELKSTATSLRQFVSQAKTLPTNDSGRAAMGRLSTAASTLADQLTKLAANPTSADARSGFDNALAGFKSAAANARQVVGLPAVTAAAAHSASGASK